jgi:uncharacterized protein (DUF2267 family)
MSVDCRPPRGETSATCAAVTPRTPAKLHRKELYDRVKREAGVASIREARSLTIGVFAALKAQLSEGEASDIWAQLPLDLKEVWEAARPPKS